MHFATFIINAVTFAKIKSDLDQRHELERALLETREQLKQATGLMPLCPYCHKPYVAESLPATAEQGRDTLLSATLPVDPAAGQTRLPTSRPATHPA